MSTMQAIRSNAVKGPRTREDELRRRLIEALLAPVDAPKMTYEEFLAWADEDTLAEWVNGEVIMNSPASLKHQNISLYLGQLLGVYAKQKKIGHVLISPFQMKLESSGREPDLIFVAHQHLERLKDTYLDGPADLVVEITSPESMGRDRGDKFNEYEQAGIPEYWLIDPIRERAEFYQLDERGRYDLTFPDADGVYRSKIMPGFWLRVDWLWSLPPVVETLRELGVI